MTNEAMSPQATPQSAKPVACRCELFIPGGLLDGYACGRPDCWRTKVAKASFEGFVSELVRKRDARPPAAADHAHPSV